MALRTAPRPRSASGKLETFPRGSILNELRESTAKTEASFRRARTSLGCSRLQAASPVSLRSFSEEAQEESSCLPEWLVKELLKGQQRSHSVGLLENILEHEGFQHHVDFSKSLRKGKIEQQVTLEQLQKLNTAFQELEKNGCKSLDIEKFKQVVKMCMTPHRTSDEQIEKLFMKIDCAATGRIQWDEFCTYMQLEYAEQDVSSARLKELTFSLPAVIEERCHGEPVLRICSLFDNTLVMTQEDGVISFWSPQLKLKRSKMVFEKLVNKKSKWATDFTVMTHYNKLILGTGDREIQLYEMSNFEPYCQISGLEAIPLKLDYCCTDPDECMILYGDDQGCVNILLLSSVGELLRTWKKLPMAENLPSIGIENAVLSPNVTYIRWKVHGDWVTQLHYYDSIKAVISTSNHEPTALVIGCIVGATNVEQQMKKIKDRGKDSKARKGQVIPRIPPKRAERDQTVFQVYKGVKTFAFCKKNNLIVTGGMDRIIRMWNPYMSGQPTGILRSHTAPVCYLSISAEDAKIFSMSTDNTIKIWDIVDQTCLFTACSKTSGIKGELTACHYTPGTRSLCVAADTLALLHLKLRPPPESHLIVSHKEPVLCCKYNKEFRHVVSCSEGSVVKVWDFETGKHLFEFSGAHGGAAITCLTFDVSGRRLITGGRDGCLKIWNYNNGHCLNTLKREDKCAEVCDCTYVEVNRSRYIIAVGWDRRISMYFDSADDLHHFQKPQPYWQDDLSCGHKEDILCIAQCPPTLLATSSYDGEIIIWNMISGHIYRKLHTSFPAHCAGTEAVDTSITQLVFLRTRAVKFESTAASLISNGPQGSVNFWSLFSGIPLTASFIPSRVKSHISSIAVTADNSFIYAADDDGYVYVYSIKDYALQDPEREPPKYVNHWRAHVNIVVSVQVVDEEKVLLSSSIDCTIRLWSLDGEYIGTFGQAEPWEIFTPASWKHPRVPYEILIDPQSMPIHPMLEREPPVLQLINTEPSNVTLENSFFKHEVSYNPKLPQVTKPDLDIKEEINQRAYAQALSKRLKQEHYKKINRPLAPGGQSTYHIINTCEVVIAPPICEKPDLSVLSTDYFYEESLGED
ncbi:cilia- and flagella-associated protein 337-like isoform X1 [Chelonoidis abingdonii]|uniref:cilia- and flagella-associated protein 337-like isoform X1 n=1 Tax=Chelonoidis abingdonii TaxID=106734 RepID=UPI0013F184DC|nr:WD repeat-containing protein 49-like isoform X1 [Chelonoidis abingdonii]